MVDYEELKRLAEGAVGAGEHWGLRDSFERKLAKLISPETILTLIAENDRIKARLCACRDCGGQGEIYSGHSSYQGHNQPPEPEMDVCGTCGGDGVLGPLEDFESLAAERDQLKAENEALREEVALDDKIIAERDRLLNMFDCPEHGQCVPYAMEQVEQLRASKLYWVAAPGSGLVRCVTDARYRKFSPSIRARYSPVVSSGDAP